LRLFSFGGYGLALAALALVLFGAYDSYPVPGTGTPKEKPEYRANRLFPVLSEICSSRHVEENSTLSKADIERDRKF